MKKHTISQALLALASLAMASGATVAHAQGAGTWFVGIGATEISPNVSSGDLTSPSAPGTKIDVRSNTQPTAWVRYMLTDAWSVEVPIGLGFKHEIVGAGAIAGSGKIATVKALPITAFLQYNFLGAASRFRPYVMLGATYAHFYGARGSAALNGMNPANPPSGTDLSVDSKWGITPGVGITFALTDKWYVDAQYAHSFLKTTTHLSTGQTISTKLDPDEFRVGVAYRF
jgi:outer membrane protein